MDRFEVLRERRTREFGKKVCAVANVKIALFDSYLTTRFFRLYLAFPPSLPNCSSKYYTHMHTLCSMVGEKHLHVTRNLFFLVRNDVRRHTSREARTKTIIKTLFAPIKARTNEEITFLSVILGLGRSECKSYTFLIDVRFCAIFVRSIRTVCERYVCTLWTRVE